MKDNIPNNNFVWNKIVLRPGEAILKIWQMLLFNQFKILFFREIIVLVYTDT